MRAAGVQMTRCRCRQPAQRMVGTYLHGTLEDMGHYVRTMRSWPEAALERSAENLPEPRLDC